MKNADTGDVISLLCKHMEGPSTVGREKMGWTSPRASRQNFPNFKSMLPKIESRPGTTVLSPLPILTGGRFVAKTHGTVLEVDVADFNACLAQFAAVDKEREASTGYTASFLASLEIFSSWPWLEVLEFSNQLKSIQIDKGLSLFCQGDRVDGIHIIHRGEAQMTFDDTPAGRPGGDIGESKRGGVGGFQAAYGFSVDVTADSDGLPMTRVSKKRHSKAIGLTVSLLFKIVSN